MKKDIYPDVRIEIISEGLTKKILESSGSPAPSVYGEEQPEGKNLPNVGIKGKNKELQSLLETSNKKPNYTGLVKEAIQELRKDNHNKAPKGQGGGFGVLVEDIAGPAGFTEGETAKRRADASMAAASASDLERYQYGPRTGQAKFSDASGEYGIQETGTKGVGTGGVTQVATGVGPGFSRLGTSVDGEFVPAKSPTQMGGETGFKPPTPVSDSDTYDPATVASLGTPTRPATSGEIFDREFEQGQGDKEEAAAIKAEADKLRAASAAQTDDEPDEAPVVVPLTSGPGEDDKGTEGTKDVDATATSVAADVTGTEPEKPSTPEIDPKITSEIGLGVRANPEVTRPKNSRGDLLPQFGSSGYFDAIVSIGEGGENVEANYGVSNLSDFLSLYAQNPQFDQTKFLENLGVKQPEAPEQKANIEKANPFKASLKKQAPPMAMTMNRPPNMGVGMQQPVVTGAGTMKNTEKAVAANKPAAVKATTKARRRKPKTIEMMVKSITDRLMKQQESDVDTFSSKRQNFGDLTTGQMDRDTGTRPGTAFTRMTDSGTDEYGSPDQFIVTPPKDADAAVQSAASKRKDIESQVASQTENIPSASGGTPQGAPPPASTRQQASQTPKRFLKPSSK